MIKLNKKGDMVKMLWFLAMAFAIFVVIFLTLNWWKGGGEKAFGVVGGTLDDLGDYDDDDVRNMFDDCPCQAGEKELDGCPPEVSEADARAEKKEYKEGKCEEFLAQLEESGETEVS